MNDILQKIDNTTDKALSEYIPKIYNLKQHDFSAQTIYKKAGARLLYYKPASRSSKRIFIIPSLINTAEIFDIPNFSFARYLQSQGIHVYLLDFGFSGKHNLTFFEYLALISDFLKFINAKDIITLGHCIGGIFAMHCLSLSSKIVLLSTPLDFTSMPACDMQTCPFQTAEQVRTYFSMINYYDDIINHQRIRKDYFNDIGIWLNRPYPLSCKILQEITNHSFQNYIQPSNSKNIIIIRGKYDRIVSHPLKIDKKYFPNATCYIKNNGHISTLLENIESIKDICFGI